MWWILQIVGCLLITVAHVVNRKYGVGIPSWITYSLISVFGTYFMFAKSYATAPTFFSAWFFGQITLGILGVGASFFVFRDVITTNQLIGAGFGIIGCVIMTVK
jgi:drug/metabolite transporter (DMT)-like permease